MDTIDLSKSPYVRAFFTKIVEGEDKNGKVKFTMKLGFPKDETAFAGLKGLTDTQKTQLLKMSKDFKDHVMKSARSEAAKGSKFGNLFKDGDEEADRKIKEFKDAEPDKPVPDYLDATRGLWTTGVSTNFKPTIYGPKASDGALSDEQSEQAIYSGVWLRADLRGYAWNFDGKKGWSLGLGGRVQKWLDDKNLGGDSANDAPPEDAMAVAVPAAEAEDFID